MISQRLRGLSQDGEAIDGLVPKLQSLFSSVGISIENQEGELRSTFDILQDLAAVWDQLSSKQKQYFGEKVAGNRQVKTLNAIMQNWDVVADTIDKANNAQGEALKGNEMYMDSIEGRMTQLQSAFQELAKVTINSDFVKGLTGVSTEVIKLVTNLGGLAPVLTTILGVVIALKGAKIVAGLKAIVAAITSMASGTTLLAGLPGILIAVAGAIAMIVAHTNEANSALKKFEEAKESYEKHKTKVENLNDELQTTRDRIEELDAKDSPTIIEQKELDRLKEVNTQLQTQIDLEKKLAEIAQGQARDAATKIIEEENSKKPFVAMTGDQIRREISKNLTDNIIQDIIADSWKTMPLFSDEMSYAPTNEEQIRLRIEAIKQDYAELVKVQEQIANLKPGHAAMKDELDAESDAIAKSIKSNKEALSDYYNWLAKETEGIDYVEGAKPGSQEAKYNELLDFKKIIGDALLYEDAFSLPVDEVFNDILSKYPEAVKELQTKIKELGDDWQLGVPDSVKEEMKQTQEELSSEAQKILNIFDQYNDEDIHTSLGDILKKLLDIGNIEDIKRPIIDAAKMYEAGWKEFEEIIGSDSISTYYSSQYDEIVNNIPFSISVTPIAADGSVLSPNELDDYVYEQIDNATNIEDLMERDKIENGGKGLFIHLTPAIDIDPDTAAQIEGQFGQLLHSIDGAFEQAFIENSDGAKVTVSEYLRNALTAAIEDPSYTGQALTEIYTVAKTLADNGYTELLDALNQVDIPEAIRQGFGLDNMEVEDLGIEHLEDIVKELMARLGFTVEEIEQAFREKFSEGIQLDIGPQMAINVEETMDGLYQVSDGYTKVLTKALSEQEKAGTLTADTLQKVLGKSGLNGIADCLERTADGYRLNTDRINEYINAQNTDIRLNALAGIMERQQALEDLALKYGDVAMAEWAEVDAQDGLIDARNAATWQNEITELQAVADEAYNAASALDALRAATKSPDEDADHTEAQSLLKKTQEAIDVGKLGTDDFKSGLDYLLGEGWYERFNGDLDKAIAAFKAKRKKFFAEDDADSAEAFMDALVKKKLATRNKKTGDIDLLTDDINKVAAALGISEDAAQDLFDLLNSYSFEGKFKFGDDAITSADEMAVAEKRLQDLQKEREQTTKDLAKAEKELEEARGTSSEEKKQKAVDDLKNKQEELEQESKDLTDAINTANDAIEKGFEPPKTLEEALQQIADLQTAIDTLTNQHINVPVEMDENLTKLIEFISNPSNVLTVDAKPGEIDKKVEELEAFKKAIDENPNISPEVKATVIGITDEVIENLRNFNGQVKKIGDKKGILQRVTIQTSGGKAATVMLQAVEEEAEKVENSDPTVTVKAELPSPEELEVIYGVHVDQEALKQSDTDIQAIADKERVATIKTIFTDGTEDGDGVVNPNTLNENQWKQYQDEVGDKNAIPLLLPDDPIVKPKIDRTAFGQDFLDALNEAERKSEPAEVKIEPDSELLQNSLEESVDETLKLPVETEQTPEEVASEFKQEWGEFWTGEKIPIGGITINQEEAEQDAEEAVEQIPEQEISAGINESQLTEQVENAVSEANPPDVVVGVKQEIKGGVAKPKDVNQTVNVKGKDAGGVKAVQDVQDQAEKGATVPVDADTSEAKKEDDSLISKIRQKVTKLVGLDVGTILKDISELEKRLSQKVQKIVEVTYKETNPRPYAKGTKKAEEGVSLVDEKGAELIEHVKQGTFEVGTNDGARLVHLDKGDVVHTADETKKILSRLGNVGGAFRNGLNKIQSFVGNAFANGSVWEDGRVRIKPKKKKDDDKKPSRGSHSGSSSGSHSGSSSSSSDNGEMSAWTDWVNKFFDWAEIKLKKLKDSTTSFIDEASRAIGSIAKNASLNKALDSIKKEIEANEKAFMEYGNTAAEIAAGLSPDIVKKIQQGDIDVSKYDELTQQKIKDYQTWYEKALACREAIKKLEDQQKELAKQSLQNIINEYSAWAKIANATSGNDAAERELREAKGEAVSGPSIETYRETQQGDIDLENGTGSQTEGEEKHRLAYGYGDYENQIEHMATERRKLIEEREKLQNELQSLMDQGLVQEGDDTWLEMTAQIKQFGTEATQTSVAIEKLKDEAKDAAMKPLKNEAEDLDYESGKINQEAELGNTRGSLGREGKAKNYQQLIKNTEEQNKNLAIQNELYRQQQEGLDENNDKYRDLEKKIRENETAMADNEQAAEEYRQAMTQLGFEEMEENLGNLTNEAEEYSDAISMNLIKGIEITSDAYQNLIDNGKAQIENLTEQRDATQALMDQLVEQYGEEAKSSDLYQQLKAKVDGLDDSIRDLDMSIAQWGDDMANLELEKLGWQLDALKSKADKFNESISLKQAQGQAVTAGDYKNLIGNAEEQNANLEEQNKKNRAKQEGMDVDSKAYQKLQAAIEANEKAINSNLVNIEKWKQAIKNIPLEEQAHKVDQLNNENQKYSDTLNLMEQQGKEITKNYYEKMISNADEQIDALNQQKAGYKALMDELVELYGESAKESDLYKQLENSYNGADQEIRQLTSDMVDWGDAIANIPIEKLNWRLDALKAKAGELNDAISFKQASGQAVTVSDYQGLINNANSQNVNLENQNKEYEEQQKGLPQNSKKYQELQAKIEANNEAMRQNNISIEQWKQAMKQVPIEEQAHKVDQLNNENQKYVDTMNLMEQQGKEITAKYYKQMLANADGQIAALEQEKAGYKALMDELVALYGESAKESDLYKQLENSYNGVDQEIRNVTSSMVEWGDAIANIPIEKLGWRLDALKAKAGELNDTVSFKQASGQAVTKEDYQGLIDNANAQNTNLENQNKKYKEKQEGLDKNSKKYRKLQADIDANNEAMRQNNISIEQWKQAMKQLPIEEQAHKVDQLSNENQKYVDTMNLMEQQGKEITAKYYKQMLANADGQIAALEQQKAGYKALMDELVALYGESAKESDLYKQLESSYNGVDQEIRNTTASMYEWGDAIANIPIEKLGWRLDALKAKAGKLNDTISFKQASGQAVTTDDYKGLINNANAQNANLEKQNERYRQQQEGLGKDSKKYRKLQADIEANDEAMRQNNISIEQWKQAMKQLPIEEQAHKVDQLNNENQKYANTMSLMEQQGKEITAKYYKQMLANADEQITALEQQKAGYKALMDELVALYGESAKESDLYKQLESSYNGVDQEIRNTTASMYEWGDAIANIPIEKLGWKLDALQDKAGRFNDAISFKQASGQAVTKKDYKNLINNAEAQNKILEKENERYRKQQEGLDKNNKKYQELQAKINANDEAIRQNQISTEQWKDAIEQIPIEKRAHQLDVLSAKNNEYNDALEHTKQIGKEVTSQHYQAMIDNANQEIKVLEKQKASYKALMDELVKLYGESAKESDVYKQLEQQWYSVGESIRSANSSIIEWEKSIEELNVEKLGWSLDAVENRVDEFNDAITFKNASGQAVVAKDYHYLVGSAAEANRILEDQNKVYKEMQNGMDVNSEEYQRLQGLINSNNKTIRQNLVSIEEWEKAIKELPIEEQSHELEQLNTISEEYNDNLKQRELLGKETVAGDYQVLIDINKESIKILNDQSAAYRALMSNLVSLYGETAKESELYKSYEKALSDTEKQTRDLTVATIELEKSMADLELEKLGWQLDALAGQSDRITNLQSLNEAQGLDKTVDAYKQLIENGLERIKILEEQNKLIKEQQEGMDINSEAYQELEQRRLSNENEIENMKIAQEQWNDSIVDIGINNIQQYKDSLAKSNEQLERQKSIQKAMQDLMKADTQRKVRTYVEGQGFVYQRDEDEYQQAQENLESILKDQLMGRLDDLIEALEDAKKNTNVYDKDGNLIGSVYETPELGNLADVLAEFNNKNKNATINIDTLRDAFGKESVSSVNNKNTSLNIGDIVINEVKDGNDLARAIIDQFPNALLQAMFAK